MEKQRKQKRHQGQKFYHCIFSIFGLKVHLIPSVKQVDIAFLEKSLSMENISFKSIREIVPSMEDVFIELIKSQENNA